VYVYSHYAQSNDIRYSMNNKWKLELLRSEGVSQLWLIKAESIQSQVNCILSSFDRQSWLNSEAPFRSKTPYSRCDTQLTA